MMKETFARLFPLVINSGNMPLSPTISVTTASVVNDDGESSCMSSPNTSKIYDQSNSDIDTDKYSSITECEDMHNNNNPSQSRPYSSPTALLAFANAIFTGISIAKIYKTSL